MPVCVCLCVRVCVGARARVCVCVCCFQVNVVLQGQASVYIFVSSKTMKRECQQPPVLIVSKRNCFNMVKVAGGSYNLLLENVAMIASRDDIARDLRGAFHWKVS